MPSLSYCREELGRRGFKYAFKRPGDRLREYWVRTDGQPDVCVDHSAMITNLGHWNYVITDYLEPEPPSSSDEPSG